MTYQTLSDDGNAGLTPAPNRDSSPAAHFTDDEIVTIATYQSMVEADLVRSELESRGIAAYVAGATIAQTFVQMPETGIAVQVASSDAATARQVAEEIAGAPAVGALDDEDEEFDDSDGVGVGVEGDNFDSAAVSDPDADYDRGEGEGDDLEDAAVISREPEVDLQRKPGYGFANQRQYDDAEAGG